MSRKSDMLSRETETIKKELNGNVEPKNVKPEINSLDGLNCRMEMTEERVNMKSDQQEVYAP